MKKKRLLSAILILSILVGLFAINFTSASAVSKPTLNAPQNISGGQRLTWSNVGANCYYLYMGTYDYNTRTSNWRVYRKVTGTSFDITRNTLHSSGWKPYGNYVPTPELKSGQAYCYQIHAGNINTSTGKPIDKNYSSVKSMTYVSVPYLNHYFEGNQIIFGGYAPGANYYQYRYKKANGNEPYHYAETITQGSVSWIYQATRSNRYTYEGRALYKTQNNGTAYSAWASMTLP